MVVGSWRMAKREVLRETWENRSIFGNILYIHISPIYIYILENINMFFQQKRCGVVLLDNWRNVERWLFTKASNGGCDSPWAKKGMGEDSSRKQEGASETV